MSSQEPQPEAREIELKVPKYVPVLLSCTRLQRTVPFLRPMHTATSQLREMPAGSNQNATSFIRTRERDDMRRMRACDGDRLISAMLEKVRKLTPNAQQRGGERELQPSVPPFARELLDPRCRAKLALAPTKINGAAIFGINQRQVQQLRALVEIRHAGNERFERELR